MGIEFQKASLFGYVPKGKVQNDETAPKVVREDANPAAGRQKTEEELASVGMDVFVKSTDKMASGADAVANYNRINVTPKKDVAVNTSPEATEARMAQTLSANTEYNAYLASEAGVEVAAVVNGLDQRILDKINVTPRLAAYLNNENVTSIEQFMNVI